MKTMIMITTAMLLFVFTNSYSQTTTNDPQAKVETKVNPNGPIAKYDKTVHEFEDLTQGNPGTATFTLTNDGKEPLIISSAKASCGCTNLTYGKDPILPGKSTAISATYNAAAVGPFIKTITVITNASDQPVVLQIKGKVVPKPAETETKTDTKTESK
jgi:hypothetical protein